MIQEVIPTSLSGIDLDFYRHIMVRVYPNSEIAGKKFDKNDLGAEMTILHLQHYVPNIRDVYQLYEKIYSTLKDSSVHLPELKSNLGRVVEVRVL